MIHVSLSDRCTRSLLGRFAATAIVSLTCGVSANVAAETPAFQGHAAEMVMRDPDAEQRHRALFFDTVDLEIGPPGLSCDHVRVAKPQAVAGIGYVVLLTARAERPLQLRAWFAPGEAASADDATAQARAMLAARWPGAVLGLTDFRQFHWCR